MTTLLQSQYLCPGGVAFDEEGSDVVVSEVSVALGAVARLHLEVISETPHHLFGDVNPPSTCAKKTQYGGCVLCAISHRKKFGQKQKNDTTDLH